MSRIQKRLETIPLDEDKAIEQVPSMTAKLQEKAEARGHGTQTAYAGVGGLVGGILGSFKGPMGAGLGALFGALLGALLGWRRDQEKRPALPRGTSTKLSARDMIGARDVHYVEVES